MTQLKHFTKTEELIGLQFEGTPESAKEIVKWVKEVVGDRYQRGQMQRGKTQYHLGYDVGRLIPEAVLIISIENQLTLSIPAEAWVVYDPNELEVRFRITGPLHLATFKRELINADISES